MKEVQSEDTEKGSNKNKSDSNFKLPKLTFEVFKEDMRLIPPGKQRFEENEQILALKKNNLSEPVKRERENLTSITEISTVGGNTTTTINTKVYLVELLDKKYNIVQTLALFAKKKFGLYYPLKNMCSSASSCLKCPLSYLVQ